MSARQSRPAEDSQVDLDDYVARYPSRLGDRARSLQLDRVTLAVTKRDGVGLVALALGDRKGGGRIQATREQDHSPTTGRSQLCASRSYPSAHGLHDALASDGTQIAENRRPTPLL